MASARDMLLDQTNDRFGEIVFASPKKFREEVFRRAGIRAKKGGAFALSSAKKNDVRVQKLMEAIQGGADVPDDLLAELVRNYLYTRRALLAEALDFLEVEHEEGLTDADLDFIEELPKERIAQLRDVLERNHDKADVELYLRFMNVA